VREEERHKRERDELEAELARVAEAKREAECALDKEEQDRIRLEGQTMLEKANVAEGTRSSKRRSARNKNVELDTKTTNRSPDAKVSPRPTNTVKNEYGEVMTADEVEEMIQIYATFIERDYLDVSDPLHKKFPKTQELVDYLYEQMS